MTDHKFEPFDRVLVRYTSSDTWMAAFISHVQEDGSVCCADGRKFLSKFVLPYDTNTKHLLNTSDHYEPPKPPHEYKWGDKVAVRNADGKWNEAVFINFDPEDFFPFAAMIKGHISLEYFQKENIRPLEPANE